MSDKSKTTTIGYLKLGILAITAIIAFLSGDSKTAIEVILGGLGANSALSAWGFKQAADADNK